MNLLLCTDVSPGGFQQRTVEHSRIAGPSRSVDDLLIRIRSPLAKALARTRMRRASPPPIVLANGDRRPGRLLELMSI